MNYENMDLIKIYRDTVLPSYFTVDWMLHDRCTYDCTYCPPANKSGTDSWLNLEKLDEFCDKLEKHVHSIDPTFKIHCLFTGGEPTVWKDFDKLVTSLDKRGWTLTITSNGSRSERWWEEYADKFASITLSYHTESVNDEEFLRKVKILERYAITSVNVMLNTHKEYFQKAVNFGERLKAETNLTSITYYEIQHTFGQQTINVPVYSKEQKEIVRSLENKYPVVTKRYPKEFIQNFCVETSTHERHRCNGAAIISSNKANFKGWNCYAGRDGIFIDATGKILRGTCRVGGAMGNILEPENIKWVDGPVVCPVNWCGCVTDILTTKEK